MSVFFADTSALAKRYIIETGSPWMRSLLDPQNAHTIVLSGITPVEIFSLLARRQRGNLLTPQDAIALQTGFLAHLQNEYLVVHPEIPTLLKAQELVMKYALRTLDAIQLAGALQAVPLVGLPITFLCADHNLLQAAAAEGFQTDNPNLYP